MDGIVNVNKPTGITSFKTVSIVRKLFNAKKAGHTGTLDPLASGVLPICLGKATRIGQYLLTSNKVYCGRMKLGIRTDTQDAEGKVLEKCENFSVDESQILEVFLKYTGDIQQIPPMFSAKKINGEKLYILARKGIVLERAPKTVHIAFLSFLGLEGDEVLFRTETSSGTYVRTLCDGIGQDLGCGAHLKLLVRERVGNMDIKDSVTLDDLRELKREGRQNEVLYSIKDALSFYPLVSVDQKTETELLRGNMISKRGIIGIQGSFKANEILRVVGPCERLLALVEALVGMEDYQKLGQDVPAMKSKRVFTD
jgi:tRNA pseudouridine55 synthase